MKIKETYIKDLLIVEPSIIKDERGYFFESYNKAKFSDFGLDIEYVQDNQSFSKQNTLRGLHYQNPPFAQTKLLSVLQGEIIDVAVDLRRNSETYGKAFSILLSAENKKQLFIPQGFAHGFSVISETASVMYKCDQFYNKASEGGIKYNDPSLNIEWGMDLKDAIVSEKDRILPFIENCNSLF
ncbi:dTDP-4-dehydrorhamnose 3,5-epimerase [Flavobacterium johnsoniae]|uniref:dTDP-4-dehydrorhamnose 3,5-epimerase n=1 Tax=Flavobacterium johnsoniae TaxID=986 RepID=UPI0025B1D0D9|nr:dTDP-4-dehydrorhamnose 3,5-epimerase [Flavobacterium johnsoniae]WJS95149.1 dTDP-4-dehydrorhamnose 3,5-epimerase [Flavobacterium johnsoniae]